MQGSLQKPETCQSGSGYVERVNLLDHTENGNKNKTLKRKMHLVVIANGRKWGNQIQRRNVVPLHRIDTDNAVVPSSSASPGGGDCNHHNIPTSGPIIPDVTEKRDCRDNNYPNFYPTGPPGEKRKKNCCPYDFNANLCETVNDRVLCGYNRNIGRPGVDSDRNLGRGCRIRGGRLECGYYDPPYTPIRRPPPRDEYPYVQRIHEYDNIAPVGYVTPDLMPPNEINNNALVVIKNEEGEKENLKMLLSMSTKIVRYIVPATKCVEIRNRVVCKPV